jgi:sterol desaturase/sphingolipid hydroxylase (fatty acid hydroxylase superfamily)
MHSQIYILVSLLCYIITCAFLGLYEKNDRQRKIALFRSLENFLTITMLSIFASYFKYEHIPTYYDSFPVDMLALVVWILMSEVIFSTLHYFLHFPILYRWIHKQHHENNPSYSTSSLDCNIIEFIITNVGAVAMPMIIWPGSIWMGILWIAFATVNTCIAHSLEGDHMVHHTEFKYNYGQGTYVFDKIMGTYKN